MAETGFDVVVIGSGPGGYVGAIRAAQLGLKTAVIEKDPTFGGTCLNVGCIPSKALLESSEHFYATQKLGDHGIKFASVALDLPQMLKRKDKVVGELTKGVAFLFQKNKITSFQGTATLKGPHEIVIKNNSGKTETLQAVHIILATGSVANQLPFLPNDGSQVISSTEALSLPGVPPRMIVIGGGAIGLEMGSVWARLGTKVTVIEFTPKICGPMDNQLSQKMLQILKKQGLDFILQAKVVAAEKKSGVVSVTYENLADGSKKSLDAEVVLVATGRKPYSEGLGLEALGIAKDPRGFVTVDDHFRTKYDNIFAIGDLIPGPMLAHKAEEEGVAVAEIIAGQAGHVNYETVPSVIYTDPEIASVGATEEQLKEKGIPYKVGTFPFSANGRAKALGSTEGMVKVIAHQETDRLLGVHILGPRASEMIAEAVVAMEFGGSAEDLARSFHAHPTLSEVVREAALNVDKLARQM